MRSVQREILQRQEAEPATTTARPRSTAELLEPGDLTRVRSKTGIRLGKEADLGVVAGVVADNTLVQVLETAENGSKLKVGTLVDGRVGKPIGWTPRRFLGVKEVGAAPPQPTAPATRQGQIQAETERLLDALEQGGEPALQAALRALESTAPSDVFVAVAQAVEAQLGPGATSPGRRHFLEFAQPRNILGHRAPGVVLPLVAGTLQAFSDRLEAFGKGLVAGLRESGVGDSDIERFVGKLAQSQVVNVVTFNSIFMAGAVKGVVDDVAGTFKLLADLFSDPHRVLSEIDQVIRGFLSDNQVAFALGKDIGQNFAKSFQALSQRNAVSFSFELGKVVGPALIGVAIAIATGGAGLAGTLASRLPTFFRTLRTLSGRGVGRLRALGKRARPGHAPDVPRPGPKVAPPEAPELGPGPNSRAPGKPEPAAARSSAAGRAAVDGNSILKEHGVTIAGEAHSIQIVRQQGGKHILTLCSPPPCKQLVTEIDEILDLLPASHPARAELTKLRADAEAVLVKLDKAEVAIDVVDAEAVRIASGLDRLNASHGRITKAKGVELVDSQGNPLGEFDEVRPGRFFEDKSARGLNTPHPRTGKPVQTAEEWAKRQIFDKTVTRIENLTNKATATRPTVGGTPTVPTLAEIGQVRELVFRIEAATPEVQAAVAVQLAALRARYPNWIFSAQFGP